MTASLEDKMAGCDEVIISLIPIMPVPTTRTDADSSKRLRFVDAIRDAVCAGHSVI